MPFGPRKAGRCPMLVVGPSCCNLSLQSSNRSSLPFDLSLFAACALTRLSARASLPAAVHLCPVHQQHHHSTPTLCVVIGPQLHLPMTILFGSRFTRTPHTYSSSRICIMQGHCPSFNLSSFNLSTCSCLSVPGTLVVAQVVAHEQLDVVPVCAGVP